MAKRTIRCFQLKPNVSSHWERGIEYKPGETVRTDRELDKIHPAKFLEVGEKPDSHWPSDIPWREDEEVHYLEDAQDGTFRVMKTAEVVRRGLSFEKACQVCRNHNNGNKPKSK